MLLLDCVDEEGAPPDEMPDDDPAPVLLLLLLLLLELPLLLELLCLAVELLSDPVGLVELTAVDDSPELDDDEELNGRKLLDDSPVEVMLELMIAPVDEEEESPTITIC